MLLLGHSMGHGPGGPGAPSLLTALRREWEDLGCCCQAERAQAGRGQRVTIGVHTHHTSQETEKAVVLPVQASSQDLSEGGAWLWT